MRCTGRLELACLCALAPAAALAFTCAASRSNLAAAPAAQRHQRLALTMRERGSRSSRGLGGGGATLKRRRQENQRPREVGVLTDAQPAVLPSSSQKFQPILELSEPGRVADAAPGGDAGGLWQARITLLVASALYGGNFSCVKLLEDSLDPAMAAAARFAIAAMVFAPFLRNISGKVLRNGLEVGLWVAMGYCAQSVALTTTTASKSAFICSLAVVFVPIIQALFPQQKTSTLLPPAGLYPAEPASDYHADHVVSSLDLPVHADHVVSSLDLHADHVISSPSAETAKEGGGPSWAAALLAAAGVACLELGGLEAPAVGDLWALAQPICFGMGFIKVEQFARENPGAAMQLTAAQLLAVAAVAAGWGALSGGDWASVPAAVSADPHVLGALLWTGVVTTALTVGMETVALKRLTAAESTVIFSTEPLWGTAFAVALLGEHAGLNTAAGAALIVCACLWSTMSKQLLGGVAAAAAACSPALYDNVIVNAARVWEPIAELLSKDPVDLEL